MRERSFSFSPFPSLSSFARADHADATAALALVAAIAADDRAAPQWHRDAIGCAPKARPKADDAARDVAESVRGLLEGIDADVPFALRGALRALIGSVDERERLDKTSQRAQLEVCARALGS